MGLHEGRPVVTAARQIELWHTACWQARDVVAIADASPVTDHTPPKIPRRVVSSATVAPVLIMFVIAPWALAPAARAAAPSASLANIELAIDPVAPHQLETSRESAPPPTMWVETALEAQHQVPITAGVPLDATFTSLRGWVHPVTRTSELLPEQASRLFGAQRIGIERRECRAGQCGVDLDGPRGRAVVAVAGGTVVRVELHELGLDGRSGRYVRIEHEDGTLTSYMHLDRVLDSLEVGGHVEAGQLIGTLGATAVYSAPPHLHFSLEVPNHPGQHGDNLDTHYVDPAPFLVRAAITKGPELRRRVSKPTS